MEPSNPTIDPQFTDELGNPMTETELELHAVYLRLEELARREDLTPCVLTNVELARSLLWNACNDLGLGTAR